MALPGFWCPGWVPLGISVPPGALQAHAAEMLLSGLQDPVGLVLEMLTHPINDA